MKNCIGALLLGICAPLLAGPTAEFRGVWVTRFEWPDPDPTICRAKIDEVMQTLATHHFNAVLFQIRGQCDTLYPSPEEPWSILISPTGADPGWDPLEYAIQAAHARKLEFHAYINTHVAWQDLNHNPPAAAAHIFYRHLDAANPSACDWLVHDAEGKPITWEADNYIWIAPGVPDAQAYTRRQIMYVVRKYDVDGVHFNRIRTPEPGCSHDPISLARQQPGSPANPADLGFDAWTNDQFTRFLCDLYAEIAEIKPRIKISAAPLGLTSRDCYPYYPDTFHYGVTKCHQDAQAWLAAGAMDFVVPQIYWSDHDDKWPDFSSVLPDWVAHTAGRHVYAGQNAAVGRPELIHQVRVTRDSGGLGNIAFSYSGLKQKDALSAYTRPGGVYQQAAPLPLMPWKEGPEEGIIIGTITNAQTHQPMVDAQIRRTGSDYVALSSADGIYSFLKVPPGTYTLQIRTSGTSERQVESVTVAAGKATRADVALTFAPTTLAASDQPAPTATQPVALAAAEIVPPPAAIETPQKSGVLYWLLIISAILGASTVALMGAYLTFRRLNA